MDNKGKIGVFDSGLGGLSVLKHLVKNLPQYDYFYFGDTARSPYGTRSQEVIFEFTKSALKVMFEYDCEIVILACNTASSQALRRIQREFLPKYYPSKRVLGVIIPSVEEVVDQKIKKVGVMATPATVESKAFVKEIKKRNKNIAVFQVKCPLLVPIIESGEEKTEYALEIVEKYTKKLTTKNVDAIVLGCTHYELISHLIRKTISKKVKLITEGKVVSKKLKDYLLRHPEMDSNLSKKGNRIYASSDTGESFDHLASKFFGSKIKARKISL